MNVITCCFRHLCVLWMEEFERKWSNGKRTVPTKKTNATKATTVVATNNKKKERLFTVGLSNTIAYSIIMRQCAIYSFYICPNSGLLFSIIFFLPMLYYTECCSLLQFYYNTLATRLRILKVIYEKLRRPDYTVNICEIRLLSKLCLYLW